MSEHSTIERPSATAAFFRGFLSSALTGAMMTGIIFGLAGLTVAAFGSSAGIGLIASKMLGGHAFFAMETLYTSLLTSFGTGVFGGVMGVKRALFDAPQAAAHSGPVYVPVPVQGITAPAIAQDIAPEQPANGQSWVEKSGRSENAATRVQQILDNGTLNDKNRAQALLEARQQQVPESARSA